MDCFLKCWRLNWKSCSRKELANLFIFLIDIFNSRFIHSLLQCNRSAKCCSCCRHERIAAMPTKNAVARFLVKIVTYSFIHSFFHSFIQRQVSFWGFLSFHNPALRRILVWRLHTIEKYFLHFFLTFTVGKYFCWIRFNEDFKFSLKLFQ